MPVLSTNRGHIDDERVGAIVKRLLESLGKNEKSIWEYYNEMAAVDDNIREVEWQDLADTILVFDGLFAAFLSAFLVFTIPWLQPNSGDIAMDVLIHISQQLSNSTTPAFAPPEFKVSSATVAVNALFFLSLSLVLIDAFLAMLVKSWVRDFDRGWRKYTVAHRRAQERERRLKGLEYWKLPELVALLPILTQSSLLFFCLGLIVLIYPIHLVSVVLSSLTLVVVIGFYAFTTCVSIRDTYAPFSSPVSRGLTILINALKTTGTTWGPLIARTVQRLIPFNTVHPLPSQSHQAGAHHSQGTARPLAGNERMGHDERAEKKEVISRSRYQIDSQAHVGVLERLIMVTDDVIENIPLFLELLDQPVKDPALWPSNLEKWKILLHSTLGLLGDPSAFSDSAARTIARTVIFCGDYKPADLQLYWKLKHLLDHTDSSQTNKPKPLNALFASYLDCCYQPSTHTWVEMCNTVAFLEPSNAADAELLWMVNTIHRSMKRIVYDHPLSFFAAVLTYISSTEQSRRSQVPLTAAVVCAVHTIRSAFVQGTIHSIGRLYILPVTSLASESECMSFCQVDGIASLDLWNDHYFGLASDLLMPHAYFSGPRSHAKWKFQLPLIASLYIDSTKQAGRASPAFAEILRLTITPDIQMNTWEWVGAYDGTKLAGYWYMTLFQEPLYHMDVQDSPFQDIGYVIMKTIGHCVEPNLSSLFLLDISVKHLYATTPPSPDLLIRSTYRLLDLHCIRPSGRIKYHASGLVNPWVLLHLETLFSQSSILHAEELATQEWADTPEKLHIANARLALYDSLEEGEHMETKQLRPDPQLLKMFLRSNDYDVCTAAFKLCVNLVTVSKPDAAGDAHRTGMVIQNSMGYEWFEHLMQVLCHDPVSHMIRSWEFLAKYLVPKWGMLPSPWCRHFASVFFFSKVHSSETHELAAYQCFAEAFRDSARPGQLDQLQTFLPFLVTLLELNKTSLTQERLPPLENSLSHLPEIPGDQSAHIQMKNILTTKKQQLVEETVGLFAELPFQT